MDEILIYALMISVLFHFTNKKKLQFLLVALSSAFFIYSSYNEIAPNLYVLNLENISFLVISLFLLLLPILYFKTYLNGHLIGYFHIIYMLVLNQLRGTDYFSLVQLILLLEVLYITSFCVKKNFNFRMEINRSVIKFCLSLFVVFLLSAMGVREEDVYIIKGKESFLLFVLAIAFFISTLNFINFKSDFSLKRTELRTSFTFKNAIMIIQVFLGLKLLQESFTTVPFVEIEKFQAFIFSVFSAYSLTSNHSYIKRIEKIFINSIQYIAVFYICSGEVPISGFIGVAVVLFLIQTIANLVDKDVFYMFLSFIMVSISLFSSLYYDPASNFSLMLPVVFAISTIVIPFMKYVLSEIPRYEKISC